MSWRTVVISRRAKLDLSMNYLEIRGEDTKRVHLSEMGVLIVESTAVSMTAGMLMPVNGDLWLTKNYMNSILMNKTNTKYPPVKLL